MPMNTNYGHFEINKNIYADFVPSLVSFIVSQNILKQEVAVALFAFSKHDKR